MNMNRIVRSKGGHFFIENVKSSYDVKTDDILKKLTLTVRSTASEEVNEMIELFSKPITNVVIFYNHKSRRGLPTSLKMEGPYTDLLQLSRIVPQSIGFNELELFLTDFGEITKQTYNAMKKIVDNAESCGLSFPEKLGKIIHEYLEIDPFNMKDTETDEEKPAIQIHQENDNVKRHATICGELTKLYERKNHDYGDSFHQTYVEEGLAMSRIRLSDKLSRFNKLTRLAEDKGLSSIYSGEVKDESIRDTLIDLANYAIMTIMELDRKDKS